MTLFWIASLISFAVACVAIAFLRSLAPRLSLIDRPGGRKMHDVDVPVVGGIGIFLGMFVGIGFLPEGARPDIQFVIVAAIFVVIGLVDDRVGLSPRFRLVAQLTCAVWLAVDAGLSARYLGDFGGSSPAILYEFPAIVLTAILVAGGVNAFNMVDGIDGLAAALGLIAAASLAHLAMHAGLAVPLGVATAISGALAAFLVFNFPLGFNRSIRCFMGDAGSLLLGFCMAWLMLSISQAPATSVQPVSLLFLVAIPIFDLLWVFGHRLARRQSPFRADNSHLHHLLILAGASRLQSLLVLTALATILAVIGMFLSSSGVSAAFLSAIFVVSGFSCVLLVRTASIWISWVSASNVDKHS